MAIEIRLLQNNEIELANNFFNEIYQTNRPLENFKWEFINGPAGKAIYVVAVDTVESFVKIVGIQCAIPIELIGTDGSIVLTAKSEDTLVHPGYRGQKIFEKMYDLLFNECSRAGIKYIWGFTPALKAFERIGFTSPFRTKQALMVIRPFSAYRHLVKLNPSNTSTDKVKIIMLCLLSWLKGLTRLVIKPTLLNVNEVTFPSKDSLLKSFYPHPSYPLHYFIRQHESYNSWRLTQNPFQNQYQNFRFTENDTPCADVLINTRAEVSYIEQTLFSAHLDVGYRLPILKKITTILIKTNTPLIRVLCFDNNDEAVRQADTLKKLGFISIDRGNHFVLKSLDLKNTVSVNQLNLSRLYTQGNT